jgi:transposase
MLWLGREPAAERREQRSVRIQGSGIMRKTRKLQESTSADFWDGVLGLEEFEVVSYTFDEERGVRRMTVVPRVEAATCPDCKQASCSVHQTRDRDRIRDLPIGERSVELTVRVPQLWCFTCNRAFTPIFQSLFDSAHATERFLKRCAELVRVSDVANAAAFFGIAEKTLEGWYYEYVKRQQAIRKVPTAPIRSIGIDELSLKKGTAASSP